MPRIVRLLLIVALVLLSAYVLWRQSAAPIADGAYRRALPAGPLVIAHQGGAGLWPSNTMLAFQNAVELGADVLELDVHRTADGAFVVIHDATVDRTTDGIGAVRDMPVDAVQRLDAGHDWSLDGESWPYRAQGLQVPTLVEVLRAFPDMPVNIEIKPDDPVVAQDLCALLRREKRTASTMVASFHGAPLAVFRDACPGVATASAPNAVRGLFVLSTLGVGELLTPTDEAVQVPVRQGSLTIVTERFVEAAQDRNVDVHVWTVDDPDEMRRLLDLGVDGIITDRPDRLLRVLGREVPEGLVPAFVAR